MCKEAGPGSGSVYLATIDEIIQNFNPDTQWIIEPHHGCPYFEWNGVAGVDKKGQSIACPACFIYCARNELKLVALKQMKLTDITNDYLWLRRSFMTRLNSLVVDATKFMRRKMASAKHYRVTDFSANCHLAESAPVLSRFCRALANHGGLQALKSCFFALHGTNYFNIQPISKDGFDPRLRQNQLFGAGEYFGVHFSNSQTFATSGEMLVVLILRTPEVSKVRNFCYVVNNPIHREWTYCLPILTFRFSPIL